MNEIPLPTPEINRYIDTAAQEAAEMAELVEEAKRKGAVYASATHAEAEKRGLDLILEEVRQQEAEVKQAEDPEE